MNQHGPPRHGMTHYYLVVSQLGVPQLDTARPVPHDKTFGYGPDEVLVKYNTEDATVTVEYPYNDAKVLNESLTQMRKQVGSWEIDPKTKWVRYEHSPKYGPGLSEAVRYLTDYNKRTYGTAYPFRNIHSNVPLRSGL